MIEPRTAKVLGALLVSMTLGAITLMLMESDPPRAIPSEMAAVRSELDLGQWTVTRPWRRIVVHTSQGGQDTLPARCHFIVRRMPDGNGLWVQPTELWTSQQAGHHIYVPGHDFNADSIGICVMGSFDRRPPSQAQFNATVQLVRQLQKRLEISADSVYLQSELNPRRQRPGKAFPVGNFNASLLK